MKKMLSILLFYSLAFFCSLPAMEADKSEIKHASLSDKFKILKDNLPNELFHYIFPGDKVIEKNNEIYGLITPQINAGQSSHEVKLSCCNEWIPSTNLNTCEIVPENEESTIAAETNFLFNVHCCHETKSMSNVINFTQYKVVNHNTKNNFYASINFNARTVFFDGPNDDGYLLIAQQEEDNQEYQYLIGKFTERSKSPDERNNFKMRNSPPQYKPKPIKGMLTALALCKTDNRCALIDNNAMRIFELREKTTPIVDCSQQPFGEIITRLQEIRAELLGVCKIRKKKAFKWICFITPTMLFGITKKMGNLYRIDLHEAKIKISLHKQMLKDKGKKVALNNIAVDSCDPHHILLHTKSGKIVYWDLRKHNKPEQGKEFVVVWENINADKLWFYDNKICLGTKKDSELHTENYTLRMI
jgi:hypothetical protein